MTDGAAQNPSAAAGRRTGHREERDPHGGTIVGDHVEGERSGEWTRYVADGRVPRGSRRVEGPKP